MEIIGYILAIFMGMTLGLIGAGGSILTVPILVYLLGVNPVVATGYSLLIVGSAALSGALRYWKSGLVNIKAAIIFALPAMLTVLFTRFLIVPMIPDPILGLSKDMFVMFLFSALMMAAALFMLRPLKETPHVSPALTIRRTAILVVGSAGVGLLTGMVGAGGGFLIIPTLIALFGLPVKEAIGTSLAIITINSLVGFQGDIASGIIFNWPLLGMFIGLTLLGIWIGTTIGKHVDGARLKKLFGIFTLLIGFSILAEELHTLLI